MEKIKKTKRSWISIIGWLICYGYFHNIVIYPYFNFKMVEWEYLNFALGIVLGFGGFRDIGLKISGAKDDKVP